MKHLLLATRNQGKVKELAAILSSLGIDVLSLGDIKEQVPEVEETGTTFTANAILKAEAVAKATGMSTVADDSGLAVDALEGRPGVYSARYVDGSDADRYTKVLQEMEGKADRSAQFVCVIAYHDSESGTTHTFEGVCSGRLATVPQGTSGFGYDPIFIPEGYDQTFGELSSDIKNTLSHRGKALHAFAAWLQTQQ